MTKQLRRDFALDDDATQHLRREVPARTAEAHAFTLEVIAGSDQGRTFDLTKSDTGRLYVGKSATSDIALSDPSVSRRHGAIEVEGARVRYTDLQSTNGTRVNGVAVLDVYLTGGELIEIGDTKLRLLQDGVPRRVSLSRSVRFGRVIGSSAAMRRLFPLVERIAASDVPVIIEGETGTGKEALAESIHEAGKRASGPFVVFDCTAVPPALVESALFGHERGAFTGAVSSRQGVFEQAHGGTLLIDEIGDLDIALQAKLLRAIERSQVQRVGGSQRFQFDVRILCATRRDLEREIQEGRFRDDLYYRLAVARVELPPLRKREGDIALLAAHFWVSAGGEPGGLTPQILNRFKAYAWPGNVRELRNAVAHELALGDLADAESIRRGRVSEAKGDAKDPATDVVESVIADQLPYMRARERVMSDFHRRYCEALLERFGGNVTKASAASGIGRRYFYVLRARGAKSTPT